MRINLRKNLLLAVLALASAGVMAQGNDNRDEQNSIIRGPYETNRFVDNIFIGIGGGVNVYIGENDSYGKFGKRLAPALDINVGKWFTPTVGLRIGYSGIEAKGWTEGQTGYAKGRVAGNIYKEKFGISYLHGDLMWNITNAIGGYKEKRIWNLVPYVGAGWVRSYGNGTSDDEIGVSVGLLNNIRLCDLLDLTLEARQMFVNQRLDKVVGGSAAEGMTSVTLGLAFKFPQRGFKRAAAHVDVASYLAQIKALENENAKLADRNKSLADENEALKNRKPETVSVSEVAVTPVALFFQIGKATLDNKELTNLDFYVREALKKDDKKVFTLYGGADKATGTSEINQKLSEARAQYLCDLLVDKYGISKDRLKVVAEGDRNNRFPEPELNRTVIIIE